MAANRYEIRIFQMFEIRNCFSYSLTLCHAHSFLASHLTPWYAAHENENFTNDHRPVACEELILNYPGGSGPDRKQKYGK